jgi:diguanylate cyclase (GGDEF)-like protein/PAS domain S-box-containing protein
MQPRDFDAQQHPRPDPAAVRGGRPEDADRALAEIVSIAASALRMPKATLTLVEDHQRVRLRAGLPDELAAEPELVTRVMHSRLPVTVRDLHADPALIATPVPTAASPSASASRLRSFAGVRVTGSDGRPIGVLAVMDIEPRAVDAAELELLDSLGRLAGGQLELRRDRDRARDPARDFDVFDQSPVGMALLGAGEGKPGAIARVNRALCLLTGHTEAELRAGGLRALADPSERLQVSRALRGLARGELENWECEMRWAHAQGHDLWVDVRAWLTRHGDGWPAGILVAVTDITDRKRTELALLRQGLRDSLTDLPNRTLLMDHLNGALERMARARQHVAVLFVDLDEFGLVNDSYGRDAGDDLLLEVAERLRATLRATDIIARLGGDEFAIVCEELADPAEVEIVVHRLRRALSEPVDVRGSILSITAGIGVATTATSRSAEALVRDAEANAYRAKGRIRAPHENAESERALLAGRRISLRGELETAIVSGQLRLVYQPCFDLRDGALVAVEALLRWAHPQRGLLEPAAFLDVAESDEMIVALGDWVLSTAVRQAAAWGRLLGGGAPEMWINVAPRQLAGGRLARSLAALVRETGLPAGPLGIEIGERQLIVSGDTLGVALRALHELGVRIAVDDFGTGDSSGGYLGTLAIDTVKIDRSFIAGLGRDRTATALTTSMTALARGLGLTLVAEGVETEDQRNHLRTLGCPLAQGDLLGRPMAAGELEGLLAR